MPKFKVRIWPNVVLVMAGLWFVGKPLALQAKPTVSKVKPDVAKQIINEAEALRAFDMASSKVKVATVDGENTTTYFMDVLQSSGRRAYLEFTSPAEEVGRRMLAIKTNYWSKFPDSRRVVAISRREAIGNSAFAIADVFQMDTEADYNAKIQGEKNVDGTMCYEVEMTAKHNEAPYHRIMYTVRKEDRYPVAAKFFGLSGKHLKTMTIKKTGKFAGKVRPTVLKMTDEVTKGKVSTWTTLQVEQTRIPDEVFTQSYLKSR